jgi:hypothetical protein
VWKKKGQKTYQVVDPEGFNSFGEFVKDITDLTPEAIDTIASLYIEAKAGAAGTALGGPGLGTAAGIAAGIPLAAGAIAGARELGLRAAGIKPSANFLKEATANALMGAATLGLGTALRKPARGVVNLISDVIEQGPRSVAFRSSKVAESLDKVMRTYNVHTSSMKRVGAELGEKTESVLDAIETDLDSKIGLVKSAARNRFPTSNLQVPNFQERLRELIQGAGGKFDDKGIASSPAKTVKEEVEVPTIQTVFGKAGEKEVKEGVQKGVVSRAAPPSYPFGEESGETLKNLVHYYNLTKKQGGLNVDQMFGLLDTFKNEGYREGGNDVAKGIYRQVRGSLADDRRVTLPNLLKGTPEGEIAESAFREYTTKIDDLRDLLKKAEKSPEKFAKSLFQDKASIEMSKAVFKGQNDHAFEWMRSAWLGDLLGEAVDSKTGVVLWPKLQQAIKGKEDMLAELYDKETVETLKKVISKAEDIPSAVLYKNPGSNPLVRSLMSTVATRGKNPGPMVATILNLFSGQREVAEWVAERGLIDIAKKIDDPNGRVAALRAAEFMKRVLREASFKVTGDGTERVSLPFSYGVLGTLADAAYKRPDENQAEYLERKKETMDALKERGYQ